MGSEVTDRFSGNLPHCEPDEATAYIPDDGTMLVSGFGKVGYPKAVPLALSEVDRDLGLTVISGGSVGGEIDTELLNSGAIERRFHYQSTPEARNAVNGGQIAFHDRHVSHLGDEIVYEHLAEADVAVIEAVAVGEDWLIPSTSLGHSPACVEAATNLIVEINRAQPLALQQFHDVYSRETPPNRDPIPLTGPAERIGSPRITFEPEKLVAVVESDRRDSPYSFRDLTDVDRAIAENLVTFLNHEIGQNPMFTESLCLQFGVGSLGNALMGELEAIDSADRELMYFGEVIQDGLLDLLDDGTLDAASATSLALSQEGQERLFEAVERYTEDVVLRPGDISNSPELINRFGVVAVNSALEVDLYGHVNSSHIGGTHIVNGIGGSGDFNRNASISITALASTAGGGDTPRIVPLAPHVDHTEHEIDVIVTEQGVADLRGLSPVERAHSLIQNCSHPDYRADLRAYLERAEANGGHIRHDLPSAFDWH